MFSVLDIWLVFGFTTVVHRSCRLDCRTAMYSTGTWCQNDIIFAFSFYFCRPGHFSSVLFCFCVRYIVLPFPTLLAATTASGLSG